MDKKYDHMIAKYQHRFIEQGLKDLPVNRSEAPYLKVIYKNEQIKMNDLIAKFFFHKSHTTRVIKSLVSDGYVIKTVDPEDKRGFVLSITEKGKAVALKIIKVLDEWDNLMDSYLEKEEKEYLFNLQKKVYEKLQEYFKENETND